MKRIVVTGCLLLVTWTATAAEPQPSLSAEVRRFIERADLCEHFAGEEPYDKARARELARNIKQYCKGNALQLARLRAQYARQPQVIKALAAYEFSSY